MVEFFISFFIGFCVAFLAFSPVFTRPSKPWIASQAKWKIGDVVRLTSGSPRYHVERLEKNRCVTIVRMTTNSALERFNTVQEDELVKDTPEQDGLL